jgi:predicted nuclease of restriction endonuclease-like RecB superfamily
MLTSELIRPRLRFAGSTLSIEMVDEQDASLLQTAQELIDILQQQVGHAREAWEEALAAYEGARVDYIVLRGLAKVLTDAATFNPLETPFPPARLREQLFAYGPVFRDSDLFHPQTRQKVLHEAAGEFGLSTEQVDTMLFADRHASYRLMDVGPAWTPAALLARYNLELARGVLYWASHITIEASSSYKDLWRYIKLFKLMFWAQPKQGGGYRIDLDGPISPFVSSTLRYGRQMAAFLPALLLCERWQLLAHVRPPQATREMLYHLDYTCTLRSHFKGSGTFDSRLEADFASEFEQKMGNKRGHWRLTRESEVLLLGDTVMIPDFILVDEQDDNRKIMIELVGFWHPQYLRRKIEKVRAANCAHLLLLVYQGLNITADAFQEAASEVIFFQQKPVLKEVMETVEHMAKRVYGPRVKRKRARTPRSAPHPE